MKEHPRQLVESGPNPLARHCLAREHLQARVLEALQDAGAFIRWAFVGGTAPRFLFSIPRFSEDLDFSLLEEVQVRHSRAPWKRSSGRCGTRTIGPR